MQENARYIPALGFHFLTPLYDPLVRWFMPERKIKSRFVQQAQVRESHRVLDVGCGTGTLAILIKHAHPKAEVVGLDPDAKALEIANRKAAKAAVQITFEKGFASHLPYPDNSFDRVLSSFAFHH